MLIQSYRSGREETSLEVLRWFFVTGNSYLVLRLKLTWYFFSRNFLPSTQRKRLARGPRSLANSKFCIYVMPASEQKYYFSGNILIASGSHRQFLDNWGDLERYCGYREDNIPQLEDINRQISKSANQHISISANQQISKSAYQHISKSARQYISESVSTFYNLQTSTGRVVPGDNFCRPGIFAARQVSKSDQWLAISRPGLQ